MDTHTGIYGGIMYDNLLKHIDWWRFSNSVSILLLHFVWADQRDRMCFIFHKVRSKLAVYLLLFLLHGSLPEGSNSNSKCNIGMDNLEHPCLCVQHLMACLMINTAISFAPCCIYLLKCASCCIFHPCTIAVVLWLISMTLIPSNIAVTNLVQKLIADSSSIMKNVNSSM